MCRRVFSHLVLLTRNVLMKASTPLSSAVSVTTPTATDPPYVHGYCILYPGLFSTVMCALHYYFGYLTERQKRQLQQVCV